MISITSPVSHGTEAPMPPPMPGEVLREYLQSQEQQRFEALKEEFGQHKSLPPGYELQALLALSHFPELRDVRIRFIIDDVAIPLSSRPFWGSLWRSARNRTYLVVIDSHRQGERGALLLKNQPFNAQVGILGHELAHTVYYLNRSFLGIVSDALCQLSACRIDFERATDERLVQHGLGWQRYDHARFLRREFGREAPQVPARQDAENAYLSPAELLAAMERHPGYDISGTAP